jgi:hypothetical protein
MLHEIVPEGIVLGSWEVFHTSQFLSIEPHEFMWPD